jgi:hypothetical protein
LSDADSATIRRYGILNPLPELALAGAADPALKAELSGASPGTLASLMAGMAFRTFVVDRQGRVTSRFFEELRRAEYGCQRHDETRDG